MEPREPLVEGLELPKEDIDLLEKLKKNPIQLIPEKKITLEELKKEFSNQDIVVCDFYLDGIEAGQENNWGFVQDRVINIDHHASVPKMEQFISSTNLAIKYVKQYGPVPREKLVLINHTDADSILSSLIMRGIIPPESQFGEAAIAGDHTGKANKIGDLLQALQHQRDLELSVKNLQLLFKNQPLEPSAQELLNKRLADREYAKKIVKEGQFQQTSHVHYAVLKEKIDGGLLPALLPEAKIIMLASPLKADPARWEIKLRLGENAQGLNLNKLGIKGIDKNYGGRFNAGSNKRSKTGVEAEGGTDMNPKEYAEKLNQTIEKV